MLLGWIGCHNKTLVSVGHTPGQYSGVWGCNLHCSLHHPSTGFAVLTRLTASMSLRMFQERGNNNNFIIYLY